MRIAFFVQPEELARFSNEFPEKRFVVHHESVSDNLCLFFVVFHITRLQDTVLRFKLACLLLGDSATGHTKVYVALRTVSPTAIVGEAISRVQLRIGGR